MSFRYNIKNYKNIKTHIYFKPTESNNLEDIKLLLEDDDRIDIYPNNEDVNQYNNLEDIKLMIEDVNQYNNYKNVTEYIYRIIKKSGFLCKGLNPDYILDSFDKVDAVVIIGSSMNILPNGNIFGFALIKFNEEDNSIYIDVICSHIGIQGAGDILINEIEYISRKLLMTEIYLTSVDSAISFYKKYGFSKYDELCDDMCLMIKSMNKKNGGKKGKKGKTNKQKKIKKNKKTRKNRRLKH